MENPIKMDDLGVPLFSETSIYEIYCKQIPFQSEALDQRVTAAKLELVVRNMTLPEVSGKYSTYPCVNTTYR